MKQLSISNETQCVSLLFFLIILVKLFHEKITFKCRFIIELINNLNIVDGVELKFLSIYPLPALLILLPLIHFTTEEMTHCTKKAAKGANKASRNLPCFLFHVLLFQ